MTSLILVVVVTWGLAGGSRDWMSEMYPSDASREDSVYFPTANGCKFLYCFDSQYFLFGANCSRVPENPGSPGTEMSILSTHIPVIEAGVFESWGQILSLNINMNGVLREIQPRAFSALTSLRNLSISNNYNLQTLRADVFHGLVNLEELRFIKNPIKSLYLMTLAVRPFILPKLKYLDLSDNPIQKLSKENFTEMGASAVEVLTLRMCGLYSLEPDTFSSFKKLRVLNLENNKLGTDTLSKLVVSLNQTAPLLRHLGISSNFLNKNTYQFLSLVAKTNISSLDLKENHFEMDSSTSTEEKVFPLMPNIEDIDLSSVVGYDAWTLGPSFPNLRRLILSKNRISGLLPGLQLKSLVEFDLSENVCENCLVKPHFEMNDYAMVNMNSLERLTIANNYLYHVSRYMFAGLTSLKTLDLSNCSIYSIMEYAFENLTSLEHLDLSRNKLTMKVPLLDIVFFGLGNLESLRIEGGELDDFPQIFKYMTNLKYLSLKDNKLIELNTGQLALLAHLELLDLSINKLQPWNERYFSQNNKLTKLIASDNNLYRFTQEMLDDLNMLKMLRIRNNPVSCNCQLVRILFSTGTNFTRGHFGLGDPAVKCHLPKEWVDKSVIDFLEANAENVECLPWNVIGLAFGLFFLSMLTICSAAAYYLRWYIRYWVFLFRQKWRSSFPGKKPSLSRGKFKYDAFVSYCNEDRNFVIRLVAMLENYDPHYRLCVFERDFNAGDIISQSVIDCLSSSRKSILVLTDAFARSQWCQWELQMAQHKRIFFKQEGQEDSLILVKLGEVMETHMTPTLRYLMKTRVYLQWHSDPKRQRIFWQKLRDALKPSRCDIVSV